LTYTLHLPANSRREAAFTAMFDRPGTTPSGLTHRSDRHPRPGPQHPDKPMTDRAIPAAPGRLPLVQDQLPDSKINYGHAVHSAWMHRVN
jgi:hypothetical protein